MIRSTRVETEEVQHCSKGRDGTNKSKTLEGGWDRETNCNSMMNSMKGLQCYSELNEGSTVLQWTQWRAYNVTVNSMKGLQCSSENTAREVATRMKWLHVVTEGKQICAHICISMHVNWDTFKGIYWTSSLTHHQVRQALSLLHRSCESHT